MKRYKKLVIGGISSKIFILILLTVILVSAAYLAVSLIHGRMLSKLVVESSEKQHVSITETTSSSMDQVVTQSLWRGNRTEARLTNAMLDSLRARVTFLGSCAATLFADPESYSPRPYSGPDPNDDGIWSVKAIYADGVDPSDPVLVSKLGLLANMSDTMLSLCSSFDTSSVYFALPEGGHLSASTTSSDWLEDGRQRSYDPRERQWYQQAVEAGELIFTDGEFDAVTGVYCIECAMPVYGPDGSLQAVVGADLYLNEIQKVLHQLSSAGEYTLLINQNGQAVLPAQAEVFPMDDADRSGDIRDSRHEVLGQTVENALQGEYCQRRAGGIAGRRVLHSRQPDQGDRLGPDLGLPAGCFRAFCGRAAGEPRADPRGEPGYISGKDEALQECRPRAGGRGDDFGACRGADAGQTDRHSA